MYYVILTNTESGVIESSANNNILSIRDEVDMYDQRYEEVGVINDSYSSKRKSVKRYFQKEIPEIDIVDSQHEKESQCLKTIDLIGLLKEQLYLFSLYRFFKIYCFKLSNDMLIDLTKINFELNWGSSGLIGLHSYTGNDVVETFSGKSKRA